MANTRPRKRTDNVQPQATGARPTASEPPRRKPIVRIELDREALSQFDKQVIAAHVGIGLAAGWLASWFVGGSGMLRYIATGLVGSFVGGWLLDSVGLNLGIRSPLLSRIATATIGAAAVVLAARIIA